MAYSKVKVYSDGGHYIGIPYEPNPHAGKRRKISEEAIAVTEQPAADKSSAATVPDGDINIATGCEPVTIDKDKNEPVVPLQRRMTRKELFDELYQKSADMKLRERKALIQNEMLPYFKDSTACHVFVESNFERKKRNMICRKIRLWRKINQQRFNFFATFTYSDTLHTEKSFKKALSRCLQHFSSRKGWRYIGVWERSSEKKRLHFHGIFSIPDGTMPGKNEEVRDFDTRASKMRTTYQNDFFGKKFGRNDFKPATHSDELPQAIRYLTTYLEKTGEKLVYSRGLYQYFVTDIMDEDIVCTYGIDDRKLLLFDNFRCWDEGCYIGDVSREVIAQLPKVT